MCLVLDFLKFWEFLELGDCVFSLGIFGIFGILGSFGIGIWRV